MLDALEKRQSPESVTPEAVASFLHNFPTMEKGNGEPLASLSATDSSEDPSVANSIKQKRSMSDTIDAYIAMIEKYGFVPSQNKSGHKRDSPDVDSASAKRDLPDTSLIISLLEQNGFFPNRNDTKTHGSKRAIPDHESSVEKRTIPDIGLVISRLEAHGFIPNPTQANSHRSIEKRQSANDISYVIGQLKAAGFDPNDYVQGGSSFFSAPSLSAAIVATSSTSTATPSSTSKAPTSLSFTPVCPNDNFKPYTSGGATFKVICGFDFPSNDLPAVHTDTLALCLDACSKYTPQKSIAKSAPCVAASWDAGNSGTNCKLKYAITNVDNTKKGLAAGLNTAKYNF